MVSGGGEELSRMTTPLALPCAKLRAASNLSPLQGFLIVMNRSTVTALLLEVSEQAESDGPQLDHLVPLVYDELRRMAHR